MRNLLSSIAFGFSLALIGCMPKGMNADCRWPAEPQRVLDLQRSADRRHLVNDVRAAEELGVRYEDSRLRRGPPAPGAPGTRDECDAALFEAIADSHAVRLTDVHAARQQLAEFGWDAAAQLPLVAFVAFLTIRLGRVIRNRFSSGEMGAAVVSTLFVSVVLGGLMLALGQLWDGFVEMARVGNQHLTYRALRLGWRQHAPLVFTITMVSFWIVVLLLYRARSRETPAAAPPLRLR